MTLSINTTLKYIAEEPSSVLLNVRTLRPSTENIFCNVPPTIATGDIKLLHYQVAGNNTLEFTYTAELAPGFRWVDCSAMQVQTLPPFEPDVMPFLYPSRYCAPDELSQFATRRFSDYTNAFEQVLAITDWIFENVQYESGSTDASTTATDIILSERGVCRDFAHLGVTLCRALSIPARYCSVYAYQLLPQDFHACFEAFIGGVWIVFDATRLAPLNGLVKIAHGRDAADTAVSNLFGNVSSELMEVSVTCDDASFTPIFYQRGTYQGICLE